jgi:hypothetical protein
MNIIERLKDWPATLGGLLVALAILAEGWLRSGSLPENWVSAVLAVVLGVLTGSAPKQKDIPRATPVDPKHLWK